jgi:membrane protease YdiL (CAAX protease family)
MGHRVGLGAPWLRALVFRRPRSAQAWWQAAACGALAACVVLAMDPLFAPYMPKMLSTPPAAGAQVHALAGFFASFYGGIAEEVQLRLFLVTLLAWGMCLFNGGRSLRWHLVLAVVLAAIAFGAGHLPAAAKVWPLDAIVVARTVLLNAIAGLVFGWFYVRHGLESAMLAHFCADLVLHVAAPLALA